MTCPTPECSATIVANAAARPVTSSVSAIGGSSGCPSGSPLSEARPDIASAIVNSLALELPRRLQAAFFEVVQRSARESGDAIGYDALTTLFKETYGYDMPDEGPVSLRSFELEHLAGARIRLAGDFVFAGKERKLTGLGNGPLSAVLACLHESIAGTLTIREYSEHAIGSGTDAGAASYVELVYEVEVDGQLRKSSGWGVSADTDIAASGLRAVMRAASRVGAVWKN